MRSTLSALLILACALAVPGSAGPARARKAVNQIRIATLAPRNTELTRGFAKIDRELKKATQGKWGVDLYAAGVAGDERDVIRKMRVGQMDASIITTTGLSQIVREVAVLDVPGVINNYKQLDRVLNAMLGEWNSSFDKAGFELIEWGESGQYRFFSKRPLRSPGDLRNMRPWLWPESHVMKEMLRALGATGVPLGVPEVYGGLQTKMVDAVMASSLAVVALQWHAKMNHVTTETSGVLLGAMIVSKKKWNSIPAEVQPIVAEAFKRHTRGAARNVRKDDLKAFKRLVAKRYAATTYSEDGKREWARMVKMVQKRLTGRAFPKVLLDKVLKAAGGG